MSKYARLSGDNRLTVRQVEVIMDCRQDPTNLFDSDMYNQRGVLDNAFSKLSESVYDRANKKYAHLGSGNRMTRTQVQRLQWFIETAKPFYRRSNPQIARILGNALKKLVRA